MQTKKYDYHLNYDDYYWSAWINYEDEAIYLNLKKLDDTIKDIKKYEGIRFTINDVLSGVISHEEIHRCIYFLEGRETTRRFDKYVIKQLDKKNIKRLIEEGMW
jgi:hypothetical protein